MADSGENIGGVNITIGADYSQLQADFATVQTVAAASGAGAAEAFEGAAASVTTFDDAVSAAAANATAAGASISGAGDAAAGAGDAADGAAGGLDRLGHAAATAGQQAHEAGISVTELFEAGLGLLGIEAGVGALKELATEALEAYSAVERATVALTAMTGSAQEATEVIAGLKDLAISDALSFPGLLQGEQRMVAFGFSMAAIPGALRAAADAAAATGNEFGQVTNSLDRIAISGMLTGRQLAQLGLSTQDVATAMGVSVDQVKEHFKDLDQTGRLEVLTEALGKFAGVAQAMATTVSGEWQNLKTESEFAFEAVGAAIAPLAKTLLELASGAVREVGAAFESLGETFRNIEGTIEPIVSGIGQISSAIAAMTGLLGPLKTAWSSTWSVIADYNTYALAVKGINAVTNEVQILTGTGPAIKGMNAAMADTLSHWEKLGTSSQATMDSVAKANAELLKQVQPLLDVVEATDKTQQAYRDAKAVLDTLTQAYQAHQTVLNGHVVTLDDIATANKRVESAAKAAGIGLGDVVDHLGPLHDFVAPVTAAAAGMDLFSAASEAAGAKQEDLNLRLAMANDRLEQAAVSYNQAQQTGVRYVEALNGLVAAQKAVDEIQKQVGVSQEQLNKAWASAPSIAPQMDASKKAADAALESLRPFLGAVEAPIKPAQTLAEAFKVLGLTGVDAAGNVETKMAQATQTLLAQDSKLGDLEAAWSKLGGAIEKLPLPQAIQLEGEFIAKLQAAGAPEQQLLNIEQCLNITCPVLISIISVYTSTFFYSIPYKILQLFWDHFSSI